MSNKTSLESLLAVENLSIRFRNGGTLKTVVHQVSFVLQPKETLALVGESGSGKTVIAQSILRLLPHGLADYPNGQIHYQKSDLLRVSEQSLRHLRGNKIAMIFQEPMSALNPLHRVEWQIAELLERHQRLTKTAARQKVLELLDMVGLGGLEKNMRAFPHELSGGQRQRVVIAMALANKPEVLIADEPTTALNVTLQLKILDLLKKLQAELGMSLLLISHDLNLVRRIANRVVVLQQGTVVEQGLCGQVLHSPQHGYTKTLIDAEPKGTPIPVQNTELLLRAEEMRVWFPIKQGVLRRTTQYVKAVDGVQIHLAKGETLGVVGESGSGKSSLGLAILRLIPSQGSLYFAGRRLDHLDQKALRALRRDIQIVFQDPYGSLSPRLSVGQIIGEGLRVHRIGTVAQQEVAIVAVLKEVGMDPETRHRYPHEFSGGQRQRIAIARALIMQPKLIVLDEPTSALDRTVQQQILLLLRRLQEKYALSYIFISHDLAVVKSLSHQLIVMKDGKVVEQGTAASIFAAPQNRYTQLLLEAAFASSNSPIHPKNEE